MYVAPEALRGAGDGAGSHYPLAVIAYEMFTGVPPFRRDDPTALFRAYVSEPPAPASAARPELGPGVDAVFDRALAKSPDGRHRSALAFVDALADAAEAGGRQADPLSRRPGSPLGGQALRDHGALDLGGPGRDAQVAGDPEDPLEARRR